MKYLVGAAEGRDLLNSVRAVRELNHAGAGARFALWGHSQGGHAVLFAAQMASAHGSVALVRRCELDLAGRDVRTRDRGVLPTA